MAKTMFLSHSSAPAGAELYLLRLLASFDADRALVVLAAPGPMVEMLEDAGVEVHMIPGDPASITVSRTESGVRTTVRAVRALLTYGWTLGGWARDHDVEVITAWTIKSLIYGFIAARRAKVPLVWCVNDRMSADYLGRPRAFVLGTLAPLVTRGIMVNSRATLATIRPRKVPVIVAPPGIDIPDVVPRRRQALSSVVMVGRISEWKGQAVLIEAFHSVFADSEVELVVVGGALFGETAYADSLIESVQAGPCADRIHFVGHVSDVAQYLDRADVMVHASIIPEPFGAVVLEGMSAGLAVIATAPGGPAEVITDDVDGLLVPCGDVEALTAALTRLREEPKTVARLSHSAVGRAADFDVTTLSPRVSEWIDDVRRGRADGIEILVDEPHDMSSNSSLQHRLP